MGGCYIVTPFALPPAATIEMLLRVRPMPLRMQAVVRSAHKGGMSVEFRAMGAGGRKGLQEVIADLERSSSPLP
jgi:hypothetical protein